MAIYLHNEVAIHLLKWCVGLSNTGEKLPPL